VLKGHFAGVWGVCAVGRRIVSASTDETLRVWDAGSGVCERVLEGHAGRVTSVCALPDGRIVSASMDTTLRVWDTSSGACVRVLEGHTDRVMSVAALQDGRIVADDDGSTGVAGLFAGGDCRLGGRDLTVEAVEDGKRAARAIHTHLMA
jgi:WD40 repeat protein